MKFYTAKHSYGFCMWYGNVQHDYGQFEINNGQFGFFYNKENDNLFFDNDKEELEFLVLETPSEGDSDKYVSEWSNFDDAITDFKRSFTSIDDFEKLMIKSVFN